MRSRRRFSIPKAQTSGMFRSAQASPGPDFRWTRRTIDRRTIASARCLSWCASNCGCYPEPRRRRGISLAQVGIPRFARDDWLGANVAPVEFDIFFSICQTEVHGYLPTERVMFENFFEQVELADRLGFGTGWVAESHLSTEVQKINPGAVIPNFVGEIGLNTDILQLAHRIFARTKRIGVGSAIMNILCNVGPIAAAERIKAFLALHGLDPNERRILTVGLASGRFPFINVPYGIVPRGPVEEAAWPLVKNRIFEEATEIFLRLLKGETLNSSMIATRYIAEVPVEPRWVFPNLKIIPQDVRME